MAPKEEGPPRLVSRSLGRRERARLVGGAGRRWAGRQPSSLRGSAQRLAAEVVSGEGGRAGSRCAARLGVGRKLREEFSHSRGCGSIGCSSQPPATAMAKGRVAERTQTGARHSTPVGDRATGTRGSATPGSGEHLKGEWTCGPDLRLPQRPEGRVPQQISGKDRPFSSQGPQQ